MRIQHAVVFCLCLSAAAQPGGVKALVGGTLLNLGSHWKAIGLDAQGRIAASVTSLAGELIHVAQTETILASSVPHERPQGIDRPWMESGMRESYERLEELLAAG